MKQQDVASPPKGHSEREPSELEDTPPSSLLARKQSHLAQEEPEIPLLR